MKMVKVEFKPFLFICLLIEAVIPAGIPQVCVESFCVFAHYVFVLVKLIQASTAA